MRVGVHESVRRGWRAWREAGLEFQRGEALVGRKLHQAWALGSFGLGFGLLWCSSPLAPVVCGFLRSRALGHRLRVLRDSCRLSRA